MQFNRKNVVIGILIIFLLLSFGFNLKSINIFGLQFEKQQGFGEAQAQQANITAPIQTHNVTPDITIDQFELEQSVYATEENATATFIVSNNLGLPYNITVNWFFNETRYSGWQTLSTKYYSEKDTTNSYRSWYRVTQRGIWQVQLLVKFDFKNETFTRERITEFKVL